MARLTSVSPVLLVTDLDRAVAFWRDGLGFECHVYGDPPNFASASRDEATVLLSLARDVGRIVPNWEIVDGVWNVYIRVDDVDTVYAEVQGRGTPLDYTICDQPWGY